MSDRWLIGCLIVWALIVGLLIYTFMVPSSPVYSG
jgi:hypothetical protein